MTINKEGQTFFSLRAMRSPRLSLEKISHGLNAMTQLDKERIVGASPTGAAGPDSAARAVQEMFTSIAPRYDLLNHLLSFNIDRLWWWRAARRFDRILKRDGVRVLDLCCGTGDMAFALWRRPRARNAKILGADFSHAMLQLAAAKSTSTAPQKGSDPSSGAETGHAPSLHWVEADALRLPFPDAHFDLVTSAFGFRNLADYDAGLREIVRVLRPGGECGILDFGEPRGLIGQVYRVYFKKILPKVGTLISGVRGPYAYLPASVERFPPPEEMMARMKQAGFAEASWTPYTFGIAGLYWGVKSG
jgi:demethylmenaquinone methyltransferase/2-methoxy-6-polyprenyl-1,4-benzoquinol methylase